MSSLDLGRYGHLTFSRDHWLGQTVPTAIGVTVVQIDGGANLPDDMAARITAVLDQIAPIDSAARAYLSHHAPEDVERAKNLIEPSLLFGVDDARGDFTLFYSGEDEDDEMCYGVNFKSFSPFDLTIGD